MHTTLYIRAFTWVLMYLLLYMVYAFKICLMSVFNIIIIAMHDLLHVTFNIKKIDICFFYIFTYNFLYITKRY